MNSTNDKSRAARPIPRRSGTGQPIAPPAFRPSVNRAAVQATRAGAPQARNRPVAPPVYTPLPAVTTVQRQKSVWHRGPMLRTNVLQRAMVKTVQQTTHVSLYINGVPYTGSASGQYGHAEMEALRKFIVGHSTYDEALTALKAATKTVSCTRIPVCVACSMVLQSLGFSENEAATEFSAEQSGGVAWGGNLAVEELMKKAGKHDVYLSAKKAGAK